MSEKTKGKEATGLPKGITAQEARPSKNEQKNNFVSQIAAQKAKRQRK